MSTTQLTTTTSYDHKQFIQEKYVRGSGVWEGDLDNETLEIYKEWAYASLFIAGMLLLVYVYRKCVETFKSNVRHRNAQEIHNLSLKISKRQKQVTIHDILKNDNTSTTEDVPGALSAKARKEYLKRKDIPLVVKSSAYLLGLENKISLSPPSEQKERAVRSLYYTSEIVTDHEQRRKQRRMDQIRADFNIQANK